MFARVIIKKINIDKYGKLKNFTITFSKGMNVIYGENEAGKSTLQSFIKSMFYGMNSKKKHIKDNDRKKYLPWDETIAKGELYYEHKEREYIIKRTFGSTKKSDSVEVIDAITGKEISLSDKYSPGLDIFGLGEEAFVKTVFVKQMGSIVTRDKDDQIMQKLINLKQTGDENVSYHKAISVIQKSQKQIENSRKTGELDKLMLKQKKLHSELMETIKIHEENMDKQIKYNELLNQKNIIENEIKNLEKNKSKVKNLEIYKEYKQIKKYADNIKVLNENKVNIEKQLKTKEFIVDYNFIEEIKDQYSKWIQIKKQIQEEKEELENNQIALVNINQVCEKINTEILNKKEKTKKLRGNVDTNKGKKQNLILRRDMIKDRDSSLKFSSIIGAILVISGIIGAMLSVKFLGILSILGLIVCGYSIYSIQNNSKKIIKLERKIDNLKENDMGDIEIDSLTSELSELYSKLKYLQNKSEVINKLQQNANEKILFIVDRLSKSKNKRISISEVKQTISEYINIINIKTKIENDIAASKNIYTALLKGREFKQLKQSVESVELENDNNLDEEKLTEQIKFKNNKLVFIEKELININNQIKNASSRCRNKAEIQQEIKEVEEEIKKYTEYKEILKLALNSIEDAFLEVQSSFGPKLNQKVAKVMNKITNGKYNEVKISEDYEVNLKEAKRFNIKELDYFSGGTVDQMYFALRMGIIQLISNENVNVPIFLDDTFVQYDDIRLESVLEYLYENAINNQVILLTCQKREVEKLNGKECVNVINM